MKTEKDALDMRCVTPDCRGTVVVVVIVKENGDKVVRIVSLKPVRL
jgi:Domain of unknown function (DUF5861)